MRSDGVNDAGVRDAATAQDSDVINLLELKAHVHRSQVIARG